MQGQYRLKSGRIVTLTELRQYYTYEGLLIGMPTVADNQAQLERLVREHSSPSRQRPPCLIEPIQTPIDDPEREAAQRRGPLAALPSITCIAEFLCGEPVDDPTGIWSSAVVIWFQDDFAFPVDPEVLKRIRSMDWERHADDWEP